MKSLPTSFRAFALGIALVLWLGGTASAAEIRVMISGGLSAAYNALVPEFERTTGHKVITAYGPSMGTTQNAIPVRLERGEPADVLILVGYALGELIKQGKVVPDSRVDLVRSKIGVAVKAGAPKPDISTIDKLRQTLLNAKSIAYSDSSSGTYLSTVGFKKLGVADQVLGKSRKVRGPPSGEPVVARGEAEIGFQQVAELIHVPGIDFVGTVPAEVQPPTYFVGELTANTRQAEAGVALLQFLSSAEAAPAITKAGLRPVAH